MTPETAKRKAVWLTETSGPTRQRSSQNAASRVGRSRMLLSSSKMAQRAAAARQMTVTSGCQHSGAPGGFHMLPQGRETEECPRVEDGEVQKIASK